MAQINENDIIRIFSIYADTIHYPGAVDTVLKYEVWEETAGEIINLLKKDENNN